MELIRYPAAADFCLTKSRLLLSNRSGEKYLIGLRPKRGYQSFMFYMQIGKDFRGGDRHCEEQ